MTELSPKAQSIWDASSTLAASPPMELVRQWCNESVAYSELHYFHQISIAARAAQWGADHELETCCLEVIDGVGRLYMPVIETRQLLASELRATRRPKSLSLKQQALDVLQRYTSGAVVLTDAATDTIRRALKELPDD